MTTKKVENNNDAPETKQKTCFIIMPIADHDDYEIGHFNRVYEFLIKPACEKAGYIPIRADDSKASHMIMFDILKKIVECDMAICDLSSKNANVFYELGLRQAFNKKTILITDGRDKAPFDIAGFRYVPYSPSLRVDTVKLEIESVKEMLLETESAPDEDVNSIVKLLKISPAHVEPVQLSPNESVIFNMFNKLQDQLDKLTPQQNNYRSNTIRLKDGRIIRKVGFENKNDRTTLFDLIKNKDNRIHYEEFIFEDKVLGKINSISDNNISFSNEDEVISFTRRDSLLKRIFVIS